MSAWGVGPFENDAAGDLLVTILELDDPVAGINALLGSIRAITGTGGNLDTNGVSCAVGAAAVVAVLCGARAGADTADVFDWAAGRQIGLDEALRAEALGALDRALAPEDNEWYELWEESGELSKVRRALGPLRTALEQPSTPRKPRRSKSALTVSGYKRLLATHRRQIGDVLIVPIDEGRCGIAQVIDDNVDQFGYFLAVFDVVLPVELADERALSCTDAPVKLWAWTDLIDRWKQVGNAPVVVETLRPIYQEWVEAEGVMMILDRRGSAIRPITEHERGIVPYRDDQNLGGIEWALRDTLGLEQATQWPISLRAETYVTLADLDAAVASGTWQAHPRSSSAILAQRILEIRNESARRDPNHGVAD